ncbi:TPA: hypothetical protein DHW51_05190 [Candidatus Poribacteria bacterium]|nr:hypothetical protein [Candidatus Poribacteria bacterium]HCK13494.1 hypothetical protein [Candidatus Poribacteria bacterium]|tara:strand:+ start:399 stop:587 length:189 start_codon:yes stop_codon:yes gene_type:complete
MNSAIMYGDLADGWQLQPKTGALRLPSGYFGFFWPCMIPTLWKWLIHPKLDLLERKLKEKPA